MSAIHYAIGDVHGECAMLQQMHRLIAAYHREHHAGDTCVIVHLGDYVDRGPDSAGVIDFLIRAEERAQADPAAPRIVCLKGNHEELMLNGLDDPEGSGGEGWFVNGGGPTVSSYRSRQDDTDARDAISITASVNGQSMTALVPNAHRRWLARLPTRYQPEEGGLCFVHAGIEPRDYPDDAESVRMWTRSPRFFKDYDWPDRPELKGLMVVHGHTPTNDFLPEYTQRRVNVDTGAVFGGPLTCAALAPGERPVFLSVRREDV